SLSTMGGVSLNVAQALRIARQKEAMTRQWGRFTSNRTDDGTSIIWRGPLRGLQKYYQVAVVWDFVKQGAPWVCLLDPPLAPREGGAFEDIPHLWYHESNPSLSGLCLFDPEGGEWNASNIIAQTTVP